VLVFGGAARSQPLGDNHPKGSPRDAPLDKLAGGGIILCSHWEILKRAVFSCSIVAPFKVASFDRYQSRMHPLGTPSFGPGQHLQQGLLAKMEAFPQANKQTPEQR